MGFKFDGPFDREGTNSIKWDYRREVFGRADILPMWVADSDWPTAPPVKKAIIDRAEHGIFGYTKPGERAKQLVVNWMEKRHGWKINPDWLVFTNGVVPTLGVAIKVFSRPGDGVVLQPPVYYPFYDVIQDSGTLAVDNELIASDGKYMMDHEGLADRCSKSQDVIPVEPDPKIMLLCNPHNPVGRVWDEDELRELGRICLENDLLLISDDIHAEFVYEDHTYTPVASLDEEIARNSITLISPSKTFNTAGLPVAIAIIPNPELRNTFTENKTKILQGPSIFGLEVLTAAYDDGEEWLEGQLDYLESNIKYTVDFVEENMPRVEVFKPEGTMLVWLDFNDLGLNREELHKFLVGRARVGLDFGEWFGSGGSGFARLNVACSRYVLEEGLNRISKALDGLD